MALTCSLAALLATTTPVRNSSISFLSNSPTEVEQAFIKFIAKYGRAYASKEELPKRFEIFSKNYNMIQAHNSKESSMYKMEINKFSDWSPEVDGQEALIVPTEFDTPPAPRRLKAATRIDWRETDKLVIPVPDIGTVCQAGWAFTSVGAIESAAAILY